MDKHLVVFVVANEQYGVDIAAVESIIKMQPITVIPHAPAFIEGVTNLRGRVLPVIDLRKRFGLPATEPDKETRIIIVEQGGVLAGMLVDAVSQVLRIPGDAVEPPSPLVATVDSAFITGIAKVGDRLVILLDLDRILTVQEKASLRALETAPLAEATL